jgi:hypothetical protein
LFSVTLLREHLECSFPPGFFWTPHGDFSLLLDAIAEVLAPYFDAAEAVKSIRRADGTTLINDLAEESGVDIFSTISDANLRMLVKSAQAGVTEPGLGDFENALIAAGFDVQVHRNGPQSTSPFTYLGDAIPFACAGNETSVAGNENAVAGSYTGGYILVDGNIFPTLPVYDAVAGNENTVAGNNYANAGYFSGFADISFAYELPLDQTRWNYIYFIGGNVTRDGTTGEITSILQADVPAERQGELESIILKYGPAEGWAGMVINYT